MSAPQHPVSLRQFLSDGPSVPCAGVAAPQRSFRIPTDLRHRTIDAGTMPTVTTLLDGFARAWDFPSHFGRNKDAFDDCMRDLDSDVHGAAAAGYLTVISHAELLLADEPDELGWFAGSLAFYAEHYREVADPRATFAVLLLTTETLLPDVIDRWLATGFPIVEIEV
ncbi:barstar family protein [Gordonia sp. CPCC 205515]|uniref:barstar family protein n=1 Tax=Gordonia sp. CPCC 205515 TaxID=3140791 RepID=UPI003AF3C1D1